MQLLVCALPLCLTLPVNALAAGGQVTTIHSFGEVAGDGEQPQVALTLGSDGLLYGTTDLGGAFGHGTVFRTNTSGTVTVLYSFGAAGTSDGFFPRSPLIQASDGAFYGTTDAGGGAAGSGTVFRVSSLGMFSTVYRFNETPNDGDGPHGRLVQGSDGFLYGTTISGGQCSGGGTLYRLSLAGAYSRLYSFGCAGEDGAWPFAGLTAAPGSNFYGTTFFSGPWSQPGVPSRGGGTIYRFTPDASVTTLYDFNKTGCDEDGAAPEGSMIVGGDGALYGTTVDGGKYGRGTIFRVTLAGEESVLYSFGSVANDGLEPSGSLLQLANGALVGTTRFGGAHDDADSWGGTIFMLEPDGTYTLLHSFCGPAPDGCAPWEGGLTLGPDGAMYGTTEFGGNQDAGTAFRLVINDAATAPTFKSTPASCAAPPVQTTAGGGGAFSLLLVFGMCLGFVARSARRL